MSCRQPRRSPRRASDRVPHPLAGRVALPNAIWEQRLKPAEFMILSCVCYWHSRGMGSSNRAAELVAKCVHLSVNTVKKYLATLVSKGLLTAERSLTPALSVQRDGNFFSLPEELFTGLELPPSAFLVYAYLLRIENRRSHKCHPSYRTIAAATGLAVNTVQKHMGTLVDKGLIRTENTSYLDRQGMKWTGNNEYTILPMDHEARRTHQFRNMDETAKRLRLTREMKKYDRRHSEYPAHDPDDTEREPLPL